MEPTTISFDCDPATRHGGKPLRDTFLSSSAQLFVVGTTLSLSTSPASFNTQYRLVLSPKSIPIVNRSALRIFVLRVELFEFLLFFFMRVTHWEA
ncbi:MAG TPA: hypothetical protein VG297_00705 [Bryobacteraceae bacterium]|nr:hypothetical protein [Bryobacteraceae bacterium]